MSIITFSQYWNYIDMNKGLNNPCRQNVMSCKYPIARKSIDFATVLDTLNLRWKCQTRLSIRNSGFSGSRKNNAGEALEPIATTALFNVPSDWSTNS